MCCTNRKFQQNVCKVCYTLPIINLDLMTPVRISKTSDPLGRYYTHETIANLLIGAMDKREPSLVLDLGAGDGALVGQAARVWTGTRFITVDIDKKAGSAEFPRIHGATFRHYIGDALDFKLPETLGIRLGEVDAALCNPPYIRPQWQRHFGEILEDAGLSGVFPKMIDIPADLLFLAQNLRFLKNNGRLGLILPDGIIAGERFAKFREALIAQHNVERVIELPRRIFRNTDAKAHILVLSKHGSSNQTISVQRVEKHGLLSMPLNVPPDVAVGRLDYSYLADRDTRMQSIGSALRDVTQTIFRGAYSSAERATVDIPVFHTTDFDMKSCSVPKKFVMTKRQLDGTKGIFAAKGDILLARVGRNLEEKVCIVQSGYVAVSDCVLVLRVIPELRKTVFRFLKTQAGRDALNMSSHGVGARFITINAILDVKY